MADNAALKFGSASEGAHPSTGQNEPVGAPDSHAATKPWDCTTDGVTEPCGECAACKNALADRDAANEHRIEELEDAIRDVLDVVTGWTRSMTDGEKFRTIKKIGYDALGIVEDYNDA